MSQRPKSRFWRRCRIYFRRFRIAVWFSIFVLLSALVYLNQVGLPDFVKRPLLEKLRQRGIDLQFTRLRLRWYRGIVAENVRFGHADEPFSPHLTLSEVQVQLNHRALARLQFQVDALVLRQGRLVWPIADTNQAPRQLSVENLHTQLRFLPGDQWALDNFQARFVGARIQLAGTVTNASAVREWKLFHARRPEPAGLWQARLRDLADNLERIHFSAAPDLNLLVHGDARDLQSFDVRLNLTTPGAETPWGTVSSGHFAARLLPATSNEVQRAELSLDAADAQTQWGTTTNLQVSLAVGPVPAQAGLLQAKMEMVAGRFDCEWGNVTNARVAAQWLHALTNPVPLTGSGDVRFAHTETRWGTAEAVHLSGRLATSDSGTPRTDTSAWGWWGQLEPYGLDWECHLDQLQTPRLAAQTIDSQGSWRGPQATVDHLHAALCGGQLDAQATLNVAARTLSARLNSSLDPHQLAPALPEPAQRWLAQFSWATPPVVAAQAALVLPAWTNHEPDWSGEVLPTLDLSGEFRLGQGGYRGVTASSAHSHFSYSNRVWQLPDLTLSRPEGQLHAEHRADERSQNFYWHISSTADIRMVRPLLDESQQRGLALLELSQPPSIDAEVWGRSRDAERIGIKGRLALTNFSFRGETATSLRTTFQYTNGVLEVFDPLIHRGEEQISADGLTADFKAQLVYLTNGFSTTDPQVIARAIGPHVKQATEPYHFSQAPLAHVHGIIPMRGEEDADLHFELEGGPFDWWRFKLPRVAARIHWRGEHLTLSDVSADFYGGRVTGSAEFDFNPGRGTDYRFNLTAENALLQPLAADLSAQPNHLEGRLNATLVVTNGNTDELRQVDGYGNAELRNGLIWDIPLFGVFSPALDSISPGLGSSRATAATCTFAINRGVIRSDDLEVRTSTMRLQYRGTVDWQGRVNALVEAGLLRDMPMVGPIVSTVFWPVTKTFEYRVTGTLSEPKAQPVFFVPKVVLLPFQAPFHPFRTLKGLLSEETAATATNSVPGSPPSPPAP